MTPTPSDRAADSQQQTATAPRNQAAEWRGRLEDIFSAYGRPTLFLLVLFGAWWLVTRQGWINTALVPSPGSVWEQGVIQRKLLLHGTFVTFYETVIGFAIAALIGVLSAVAIVYSPTIEKTLYPLLLMAQVIPKIAIAPLLVVWLGYGLAPKIVVAVLIAFFPVVISAVAGLRSINPELLDLSATMGASRVKEFVKIRFPFALPFIFSGLKVAITLAVVGAVVGEFVGSNEGLGYVLQSAGGNFDAPLQFACLIIMSLLGVVLFAIIELAERLLVPWNAGQAGQVAATA